MIRYETVTMEFVTGDRHCDYAILVTDKGERVYLPRSFIEAAQSGWDDAIVTLEDPGDIYSKVMTLDIV